jgi:uncharacterized protein
MKHGRDHNAHGVVTSDLKVRVDRIADEGYDLDEVITEAWTHGALGDDSPFKARGDGRIDVHLMKVENVVQVRGRFSLGVTGECSRCLGPVELDLVVPVDVTLFPRGEEPPAASEGELTPDDMGVSNYEEGIVDLASVVHDEVFLELPMTPLCKDDCAGLCPKCGQNLNEARCKCQPEVDPRWHALRGMKVD